MKSIYCLIKSLLSLAIFLASVYFAGCSVLVGQVKPVEEKASAQKMIAVNEIDASWKLLNPSLPPADDRPDAAWQSSKTNAIISLTSACRLNPGDGYDENNDLRTLTSSLLSQWRNLKVKEEKELTISGVPALETTAIGFYLNQTRKFQIIAVKTQTCVYDLIFLSPVTTFDQDLSVFLKFRDSLKLK